MCAVVMQKRRGIRDNHLVVQYKLLSKLLHINTRFVNFESCRIAMTTGTTLNHTVRQITKLPGQASVCVSGCVPGLCTPPVETRTVNEPWLPIRQFEENIILSQLSTVSPGKSS